MIEASQSEALITPEINFTDAVKERFWSYVEKTDGCWEWIGHKNRRGYGRITIAGRQFYAHRVAWMMEFGPIPNAQDGEMVCVCHRCDNPGCTHSGHLFLGTKADNCADRDRKDRVSFGERHYAALLTEGQVREIRGLYKAGQVTQKRIGEMFGVTKNTIQAIIAGRIWKRLRVP